MKLPILLVALIICGCNNTITKDFPDIATQQIDSASFPLLKDKFGLQYVYPAPEYLGGLTPKMPIAFGFIDCMDCYESSWQEGGFHCRCKQIILKKGQEYVLLKSKDELKAYYAPITSSQEALSYAALMVNVFPIVTQSFFKEEYRYKQKVSTSTVQLVDNQYIVQLYDHELFSCSHPYYSVLVKVMPNGDVQILRKEVAFEDPSEDALCID
jgi:hypothetical protein